MRSGEDRRLLWTAAMVLMIGVLVFGTAGAEGLRMAEQPWIGDQQVRVTIQEKLTNLEANVFSGDENLGRSAERSGEEITIILARELREGELLDIRVRGYGTEGTEKELSIQARVRGFFASKLTGLEERTAEMWKQWTENIGPDFEAGRIFLPSVWGRLPFTAWPDEAPEIHVRETEKGCEIAIEEAVPEGWRVRVGKGLIVEYTDCLWNGTTEMWEAEDPDFEAVYLIRDADKDQIGISIRYARINQYAAEYPVLEWAGEFGEHQTGFSCYGWGTARRFDGAMYAVADEEKGIYAEYGADGILASYSDPYTGCAYDANDQLIAGEEPEGWVNPVVH